MKWHIITLATDGSTISKFRNEDVAPGANRSCLPFNQRKAVGRGCACTAFGRSS